MKICFDGLSISHLHGTGWYSYTYELLNNLLKMYPQPKYELIWDNDLTVPEWKNISYINPGLKRKGNDFKELEEYLLRNKIDLYHSPNNGLSIPGNKVCKYIITVHELLPVSIRDLTDSKYYNKFMELFPKALEKADKVIAVSEFIAEELQKYYKISDKKLEVIYPGCSNIFSPIDSAKAKAFLNDRYGVKGDFLLYTGSIHPRKNLDILLRSFKSVLDYRDDLKLVLVGNCQSKREEYYLKLKLLSDKLGIADKVIFTGMVNYFDMPHFYSGAECSLNLSDYEGFPITTVEAMACNSPVICSRSSSFKEVTGLSDSLIDGTDAGSVKDAIIKVLSNRDYRKIVKSRYLSQGQRFQWENAISRIASVYESTVYGI